MICSNAKISLDKGEYRLLKYKVIEQDVNAIEQEGNVYTPVDLTGSSIEFQVKQKLTDPDPAVIAKSVGSGITIMPQSGETLGKFEVVIQTGDTSPLAAGSYVYDIWLIESGERRPIRRVSPFVINIPVNLP